MTASGSEGIRAGVSLRYYSLDSLRFLAASTVMFYHFHAWYLSTKAQNHGLSRNAYLMVDFFFVLSGFVIHQTYSKRINNWAEYGDYLRRRLARIYPLHLVTFLFMVAVSASALAGHVNVSHDGRFRLSAVLPNLVLVHAWGIEGWPVGPPSFNGPSWSISAEFGVYLVFPLMLVLQRRLRPLLWFVFALSLIALGVFVRSAAGLDAWTLATWDFGVFRAVPTFAMGMGISSLMQRRTFHVRSSIVYLAILLLAVSMHFDVGDTIIVLMFPPIIWLAANADACGGLRLLKSRLLVRLGEASYSIYLLHQCTALLILQPLHRLFHWTPVGMVVAVVVCGFVTLALSIITYDKFEHPVRLWICKAKTT